MSMVFSVVRVGLAGVLVLTLATVVGGAVLSAVEDVSLLGGVWLAFTVVSTTGFGDGPVTSAGALVSMGLFVAALPGYVCLLASAMMLARRVQGPLHPRARPMLVDRDVRRVVRNISEN